MALWNGGGLESGGISASDGGAVTRGKEGNQLGDAGQKGRREEREGGEKQVALFFFLL